MHVARVGTFHDRRNMKTFQILYVVFNFVCGAERAPQAGKVECAAGRMHNDVPA
jgi:hypothetical protein